MALQFGEDHRSTISSFQLGEDRFVWGRHAESGDLWFLREDEAAIARAFVKGNVICPVPGCGSSLTTVHSAKRRDHLRHLSATGGHSLESINHAMGCAVIESWLKRNYPRSTVRREEYTNESGERRADVMITGPSGARVAFEVQYSALTPDAWKRRHESYRSQGIVDVWLFGHVGAQLSLDVDGTVRSNPTHEAVVESGSPLFFIRPLDDHAEIACALGRARRLHLQGMDLVPSPEDEHVIDDTDHPLLLIDAIKTFRLDQRHGLTSDALDALRSNTLSLRRHNEQVKKIAENRRARAARERKEKQERWEARRRLAQESIRRELLSGERWSRSTALQAIRQYFGEDLKYLKERIDFDYGTTFPNGVLVRWQCVVYFELIAGRETPFGVRDAYGLLRRRGITIEANKLFTEVARYLHRLRREGFLRERPGLDRYAMFQPTTSGAWW